LSLETKTILITVKSYPNPSKKYGETVCCAGIDIESNQWIRLYPVTFRDLDESKKFSKYSIIRVNCRKAEDKRIESYKVDCDSIEVIEHIGTTKDKWGRRKKIVLPMVSHSFCRILEDSDKGKSLGVFKPCNVGFNWEKAIVEDDAKRKTQYAQLSFFDKRKNAVEQLPFNFYYSFKCENCPECPGHKLPITDWELGQSYRNWRYRYKTQKLLLENIREKWLTSICSEKNDVHFYVGNMRRFHNQFMVLGVFYPPKN
jgi:hypothetical protein